MRAFSTFKILPRIGKIAWKRESRPPLADPPALSPSTMKISVSARFDDELTLAVRTQRFGRTSMLFRIAVFRGEALLCDVRNTYVCATPKEQSPVPVPAAFVDAVMAWERVAPER